jgi:formate dehydrogenase subunit gamma
MSATGVYPETREAQDSLVVQRYTLIERVMHAVNGLACTYLILTGLAFWSPYLFWLAVIFGGGPAARFWHPWAGVLYSITLVWMLRLWLPDMRITPEDRKWGKHVDDYVTNREENVPPSWRFNFGQKQFFWLMFWSGMALLLSGVAMWFVNDIPWSLRWLRHLAVLVHATAALLSIAGFIIHV